MMEWVDRMNQVMEYLETSLTQGPDPEKISQILASPFSVFQRAFAPITGLQLSEYIRRRKLSCAAYDLRNTTDSVLAIALKYGYDSADAFTVAFKKLHGVTPQMARKTSAELKFYSKLKFTFSITGAEEMNYQVIKKKAFNIIGIRRTTPHGGGTWELVKRDGTADQLAKICGHMCDLGLCFGFDQAGNNDYMCGVEYPKILPGFDCYHYSDETWLIFTAEGSITAGILPQTWKRIYGEFMPQSTYRQLDLPTIEQYKIWDEKKDVCQVKIMIPVQE
ncbi:MAG: AraC family transcriptional regulator [Erysipelotrichaceae bacterium]|nr:AraC family transcriptional regulator [Erysipelotrichaceae bacterium]